MLTRPSVNQRVGVQAFTNPCCFGENVTLTPLCIMHWSNEVALINVTEIWFTVEVRDCTCPAWLYEWVPLQFAILPFLANFIAFLNLSFHLAKKEKFQHGKVHIPILRRPQNFAGSSSYFWPALHRLKVRRRFCKIL